MRSVCCWVFSTTEIFFLPSLLNRGKRGFVLCSVDCGVCQAGGKVWGGASGGYGDRSSCMKNRDTVLMWPDNGTDYWDSGLLGEMLGRRATVPRLCLPVCSPWRPALTFSIMADSLEPATVQSHLQVPTQRRWASPALVFCKAFPCLPRFSPFKEREINTGMNESR